MNLRLDWATHEAAAFACRRWHYSRTMPMPPVVKIGVYEAGAFIGCVLFSRGASPHLGDAYGLNNVEVCELTRVALTKHAAPVSRIIAIALRILTAKEKGLRLVVSFADPREQHHGGVYQAGNWIYTGRSNDETWYRENETAPLVHRRQVSNTGTGLAFGKRISVLKRHEAIAVKMPGKHRYLMPLDAEMRARILPLAKPYPKRAKEQAAGDHPALGGVTPTRALQIEEVKRERTETATVAEQ